MTTSLQNSESSTEMLNNSFVSSNSLALLDQFPSLSWKEKLAYLTYRFLQLEQTECPLEHIFEDRKYIREIKVPKGTLFIGRIHRHGHQIALLEGTVLLIEDDRRVEIEAPFVMVTPPQYQTVFYAKTDVVGRSYHPNPAESRDIQALEDDAFESVESLKTLGFSVEKRMEHVWLA